ncbi:Lipopolysaccharide assembly protein B [subsurface metagenome]
MTRFSSLQIAPPSNWQDFESLCCDLWREIWKDPNTQKNGRQGQPQHGVDVFGRPNQGKTYAGVQCKRKDNYADNTITEDEVVSEVEKAKSFKPPLSEFIIATSGKRDVNIQELARTITDKHLKESLFPVNVYAWEDIVSRLEEFPDIIAIHFPSFNLGFKAGKEEIDEVKDNTQAILENIGDIKSRLPSTQPNVGILDIPSYVDISTTILASEHQAEIDHSKELLKSYKSTEALEYLTELKDRIWSTAQPIAKYRILTNTGAAEGLQQRHQESAKLLIEALQYNPTDEMALCNAALGYLLLEDSPQAVVRAKEVIKLNPANGRAYSILLRALSQDRGLEKTIEEIPQQYRETPEVANTISHLLQLQDNFTEARKWLEIAVKNDKEDSPELKANLGALLLKLVNDDKSGFYGLQINDEKLAQIKEAIELLTAAWNVVANTSTARYRLDWIVIRGLGKRPGGDLDGAIEDINLALSMEPSNLICRKYVAMLYHEKGENNKSIDLLEEILKSERVPEVLLSLANILRGERKFPEAIEYLKELINSEASEMIKEDGRRLLIRLYADVKDFPKAEEVLSSLLATDTTNISYMVDSAIIANASGNHDKALTTLFKAVEKIRDHTTNRQLLELADELYVVKAFEEAANIYERIVDKTINSSLSRALINSYYRAGILDKALEICQILLKKYGPLEYISEMESAIYEEIGDLPKAKEVCMTYLEACPNDSEMQLRLAVINLRLNDFGELDKFLDSPFEIKVLSLDHGLQFAGLLAIRNKYKRAFPVIYELRRTFSNNANAHVKYMGIFIQREKDACDWLNVTKAEVDTAVCIEEESHRREWYIIEDRKDADTVRREFDLNHPLVKKILGKTVGDDILIVDSPYSKVTGKIVEIKSKYVYAFQESLSSFEKLFPESTGVWRVKVGIPKTEGAELEGFETIFDVISRQHDRNLQVEKLYRERKLTIGAFANLINRDLLDVWGGLINIPDLGINCCIGSSEERRLARSVIDDGGKIIADLISIMTLHITNSRDAIVQKFGKLGIAQSTIDLLSHAISERKGIQSKGFMVISKAEDKFVRQEISAEDIKRNLEHLEKIMDWIGNNCEVIPCGAALNVKRQQRQQLERLIGSPSIETILIASEPGNIFYSDDERLRSLAKREFNVNGIWTQVLLMKCLDEDILERGKYNESVIQLVNHSYRHISIDAHVLIEAVKQSEWSPRPPYTTVLKVLEGQYSDERSALIVGTNFLYELWKQPPILVQRRDQIILSILDALTSRRSPRIIMGKLAKMLGKKFYLILPALQEVLSIMESWEKTHII